MLVTLNIPDDASVTTRWHWIEQQTETSVIRDQCPNCGRQNPDATHYRNEGIAMLLAEPLREAFDGHLSEHGCAARGGFAHCEEAMRLFSMLPEGDQIIIA